MKNARCCLLLLLLLAVLMPGKALAATSPPDSTPTMEDIHVYRHLLESNDFLVIAKYQLPYVSIPIATVEEAFLFRLISTDNVTTLLENEAYPYVNRGYGYGLIALYASAADAPTWGLGYTLQLRGKPSEFVASSNATWNFIIPSSAYSTYGTRAGNQGDLADKIIGIAQDLEVAWSVTLLSAGDTGLVLSANGEIYFRNSILGLQVMAPALFEITIIDPDYSTENWTNAQATIYRTRLSGTWWGDAVQNIADLFGMDFHFIAAIPFIIAMVFAVVLAGRENNLFSGLLDIVILGISAVLLGAIPFLMLSIATIAIAAHTGYQWFLKSSS